MISVANYDKKPGKVRCVYSKILNQSVGLKRKGMGERKGNIVPKLQLNKENYKRYIPLAYRSGRQGAGQPNLDGP